MRNLNFKYRRKHRGKNSEPNNAFKNDPFLNLKKFSNSSRIITKLAAINNAQFGCSLLSNVFPRFAPSRRYPFISKITGKDNVFRFGWRSFNRYFRTFVFKRRTRIWVGGGQLWRLCNDERGGGASFVLFRVFLRFVTFPFFSGLHPFVPR